MNDLDKLIESAESGSWYGDTSGVIGDENHEHAWAAWNGSLDAALALHEALLPGWLWGIVMHRADWYVAGVGRIKLEGFVGVSQTHARAFLLAILKAYRSVTQ